MKLPGHARLFLFPVLMVLLVVIFLMELGIGSVSIPASGIIDVLLGSADAEATWSTIILELRLPRTLAALLGGAALGVLADITNLREMYAFTAMFGVITILGFALSIQKEKVKSLKWTLLGNFLIKTNRKILDD